MITRENQVDECIWVLAWINLTPPLSGTSVYPHLVTTLVKSLQIWGAASTAPHPLLTGEVIKSNFTQLHVPPAILKESKQSTFLNGTDPSPELPRI